MWVFDVFVHCCVAGYQVERPLCNLERVLGSPRSQKDEGMHAEASESDSEASESDSNAIPIEVHRHIALRPTAPVQ